MRKKKITAIIFFVVLIFIVGFSPTLNYTRTSWIANLSSLVGHVDSNSYVKYRETGNYGPELPLSKESCFVEDTIFMENRIFSNEPPSKTASKIVGEPRQKITLLSMLCGIGSDGQSYVFFLKYSFKPKVQTGSILGDIFGELKANFEEPEIYTYCTDSNFTEVPVGDNGQIRFERKYEKYEYNGATTTETDSVRCVVST